MTDNEIIKAKELIEKLKEAYDFYYDVSRSMPYDIDVTLRETAICLQNCLDEINSQKAEIERYEKEHKEKFDKWLILDERTKERYAELYEEAKAVVRAKAVKEFEERAIKNICEKVIAPTPTQSFVTEKCKQVIAETAQEMAGAG